MTFFLTPNCIRAAEASVSYVLPSPASRLTIRGLTRAFPSCALVSVTVRELDIQFTMWGGEAPRLGGTAILCLENWTSRPNNRV